MVETVFCGLLTVLCYHCVAFCIAVYRGHQERQSVRDIEENAAVQETQLFFFLAQVCSPLNLSAPELCCFLSRMSTWNQEARQLSRRIEISIHQRLDCSRVFFFQIDSKVFASRQLADPLRPKLRFVSNNNAELYCRHYSEEGKFALGMQTVGQRWKQFFPFWEPRYLAQNFLPNL